MRHSESVQQEECVNMICSAPFCSRFSYIDVIFFFFFFFFCCVSYSFDMNLLIFIHLQSLKLEKQK